MHLYFNWWNLFTLGDSKACCRIIGFYYQVGVKVLSVQSDIVFYGLDISSNTFKGSRSGSTSENPVAKAIGSSVESVLARCSVMVSVEVGENEHN